VSALALDYTYHYLHASSMDAAQGLRLATCAPGQERHPYFLSGQLAKPKQTAELLRCLMRVVQARYHVPAAMLERILAQSDPVVTCNDDRLRFEGFSACCGAYVRVDLLPEAVVADTFGRGTTNVDFNQPMLSALAMIRDSDKVSLSIGADQIELSNDRESVVEKKVTLPFRWLKGFVEVQACQSRMQLAHQIAGIEAGRFLRGLPRMKTGRRETWITAAGRGLRLSQCAAPGAVRVGGLERLRVLENLAASAQWLRVYSDETTGASAWELVFDQARSHLVISPDVWRGFSGEGQALQSLATREWQAVLPEVQAQLKWQSVIDLSAMASRLEHPPAVLHHALVALGARGLVGFDLSQSAYFHRELPFDVSQIERLQPRYRHARKLIAENQVRIGKQSAAEVEVFVTSSGVEHRVRLTDGNARCTCPWFARHETSRGPCKHILAAQIVMEESGGD
jgi:hypothetical protein